MTDNQTQTEIKVKKPRRLTLKQIKFREAILAGESGKDAVYQAGYKVSNDNSASALASRELRKVNVKAEIDSRIAEIEKNTNVTIESIRQEHAYYQQLALEKGDLSNATANLIAKGRTVAAYSDNLNTTDVVRAQEAAKCSADEAIELKRLANIRLSEMRQVKEG